MSVLKKIFQEKYVLASKSPRRIHLLKQLGLNFISVDSKCKELEHPDHNPLHSVRHNSILKSRSVAQKYNDRVVIGADTVVAIERKILNKPADSDEAKRYLRMLSNKRHYVYTGVNVINQKKNIELFDYVKTAVYFRRLDKDEIDFYVASYNPLDKAGAYGIQDDFGCLFIKKINGDYYNVVGLPLEKLFEMLKKVS